jgi:acyl-CoA synthetase (AMP-forming)/AMP-acid ligase II
MNPTEWQLQRFREGLQRPAFVWSDATFTYADLEERWSRCRQELAAAGVKSGDAVAVVGDFSPASVATLLALIEMDCVVVPLSRESREQHRQFFRIAELDHRVRVDRRDSLTIDGMEERRDHSLLTELRGRGHAGLILFSSGSTGQPKAILHDLTQLLAKFRRSRRSMRTLNFLLFDHIGGFNTLFYTLANLGCTIVPEDRSVASVCRTIERHGAELLPTTPSFLNLLLLAEAHQQHDLSSVQLVTYGTEVMSARTLKLANRALPNARFQQTYGLTEVGILRSKSAADDSLMVRVGGEDYETKVVAGRLFLRARSSMLGYLNAPSPFDADGWFDTGDSVVQDGEYYRILGRTSEIINVGGQKVYPAEVEQVIAELHGVVDVVVSGEPHLLLGEIVAAKVQMDDPIPSMEMKKRLREHCRGRLQSFMVPTKVQVVTEGQVNARFKKIRR